LKRSQLGNPEVERVQSIEVAEVTDSGDIFVQSDGEHFGFLPTKFSVLPGVVDFFC